LSARWENQRKGSVVGIKRQKDGKTSPHRSRDIWSRSHVREDVTTIVGGLGSGYWERGHGLKGQKKLSKGGTNILSSGLRRQRGL